MKPRLIMLIAIGILIYFSLSVYHMRQVKKYPVNTVQDKEQADWIQITTADNKKSGSQDLPGLDSGKKDTPPEHIAQDAKFNTLRQQIQTAGEEKEKLQQRVAEKEAENKNLTLQLDNLRVRLTGQQEKSQEGNAQLHITQQALAEQLQKQKTTVDQIDSFKTSLHSKTDAVTKANKRIEALSLRAEQSAADLAEAHKTITGMQTTLAAFRSKSEKAALKQQRYLDELSRSKTENKMLLAETGDMYNQLDELKSRLTVTEASLNKARLKAEAMFRYGQEQNRQLSPSIQEIERLKAQVEQQEDLLKKANQQINTQQAKLEKQIELQKLAEENSLALTDAQQQTEELTGKLQAGAALLQQKESSLSEMKTSLYETLTTIKEVEKKSSAQVAEISGLQQSLIKLGNEKKQQQAELTQATLKQTELAANNNKFQAQAEKISQELQGKNDQLSTLRAQLAQHQATLKQREAGLKKISDQLEQAGKSAVQLENIQKELQKKDKILAAAEKKISRITRQHKKDKNRLIKAENAIKKLETSLLEANKANDKIAQPAEQSRQIKQFKASLEAKDKKITQLTDNISRRSDELQKISLELEKLQQAKQNAATLKPESEEKSNTLDQTGEETKALKAELDHREKAFFALRDEFYELQTKYESLQKDRNEKTNPLD